MRNHHVFPSVSDAAHPGITNARNQPPGRALAGLASFGQGFPAMAAVPAWGRISPRIIRREEEPAL